MEKPRTPCRDFMDSPAKKAEDIQAMLMFIEREQEMRLIENLMLALPDVPALGFELGLRYNVARKSLSLFQ